MELSEAILIFDESTRKDHLYMYDAEDRPYLISRAESMALNCMKEMQRLHELGLTIAKVEQLANKEHTYENCHNYTCKKKSSNRGYSDALDDFVECLKNEFGDSELEIHDTFDKIANYLKTKRK